MRSCKGYTINPSATPMDVENEAPNIEEPLEKAAPKKQKVGSSKQPKPK